MDRQLLIENPFRPGAGHLPPVLGGRKGELDFFRRTLRQKVITENILITGLRGFGKTVLVEHLRSAAEDQFWLWAGVDLSESSSLTEERLALRIITDVAAALARAAEAERLSHSALQQARAAQADETTLDHAEVFEHLKAIYERAPGLPSDKLKAAISKALSIIAKSKLSGLILVYDEAQCLADHAETNQFPMSMLIETVAALQKSDGVAPCLLVLSGLPGVRDSLTATRTYTERMFRVLELDRLTRTETATAIVEPVVHLSPPLHPSKGTLAKAIELSGGYPYLIQFFGKELVDGLLVNGGVLSEDNFPDPDVIERLDAGLFGARWSKTTEKQREFLRIVAMRPNHDLNDFSASEIAHVSDFTNGQASQMLHALTDKGLVYRSRHGRYAFTVPMSEKMILTRMQSQDELEQSWLADVRVEVEHEIKIAEKKRWRWFR